MVPFTSNDIPGTHVPMPTLPFITANAAPAVATCSNTYITEIGQIMSLTFVVIHWLLVPKVLNRIQVPIPTLLPLHHIAIVRPIACQRKARHALHTVNIKRPAGDAEPIPTLPPPLTIKFPPALSMSRYLHCLQPHKECLRVQVQSPHCRLARSMNHPAPMYQCPHCRSSPSMRSVRKVVPIPTLPLPVS